MFKLFTLSRETKEEKHPEGSLEYLFSRLLLKIEEVKTKYPLPTNPTEYHTKSLRYLEDFKILLTQVYTIYKKLLGKTKLSLYETADILDDARKIKIGGYFDKFNDSIVLLLLEIKPELPNIIRSALLNPEYRARSVNEEDFIVAINEEIAKIKDKLFAPIAKSLTLTKELNECLETINFAMLELDLDECPITNAGLSEEIIQQLSQEITLKLNKQLFDSPIDAMNFTIIHPMILEFFEEATHLLTHSTTDLKQLAPAFNPEVVNFDTRTTTLGYMLTSLLKIDHFSIESQKGTDNLSSYIYDIKLYSKDKIQTFKTEIDLEILISKVLSQLSIRIENEKILYTKLHPSTTPSISKASGVT